MGVKELHQYILKNVSKKSMGIKKMYLCNFKNTTIVIDTSIYIYKFFDYNDYNILYNKMNKFLDELNKYQITPIFIFDGKPDKKKDNTIKKRNEEKIKNKNDFDNTYSIDIKNNLKNKIIHINKDTIDFVINIFDNRKIEYYQAIGEADSICAKLTKEKNIYGCLSDDTDMFIYGCKNVIRSYCPTNNSVMIYNLDIILKMLKTSLEEFRQICIISTTDYDINENNYFNIKDTFNLFYKFKKTTDYKEKKDFITWLFDNGNINSTQVYYDLLYFMEIPT
jgi:5'-3' exonuclease